MAEEKLNNLPEPVPLDRRFLPQQQQQQRSQQPPLPTPTSTEYMSPNSPARTGPPQQQQQQQQQQQLLLSQPPPPATTQQLQQPGDSSNSKNARPAKRQKVSLACQECRDRKIKCDGIRPVCGPCVKKKRPEGSCVYEPERGRRGVKSQYVFLQKPPFPPFMKAH
ncbi:hypothetical protein BDB00DRAFT_805810 [Zychaea mexicana]|uniref:uncharacterized protein n=1 Tax=Zychaea mexicana TaxID=64656 RepID=UPI0022FE8E8B|nr:uncharacterized protein BDB00DRAFT_805810 [Zychaea mexicana]KAI9497289.1 hypothetical protein BDB00DRAFT_805810 [Zychaea mexicana]